MTDWYEEELTQVLTQAQTELAERAKMILPHLDEPALVELSQDFSADIREEKMNQLWVLRGLDMKIFKVSLAVAEVSLAMSSLIATSDWDGAGSLVLNSTGFELMDENLVLVKKVSNKYIIARIASYAAVSLETAEKIWMSIYLLMQSGVLSFPALELSPLPNGNLFITHK